MEGEFQSTKLLTKWPHAYLLSVIESCSGAESVFKINSV